MNGINPDDYSKSRDGAKQMGLDSAAASAANSPTTGPEYHTPSQFPPRSHEDTLKHAMDQIEANKFKLPRRSTNTYEQAVHERDAIEGRKTGVGNPHGADFYANDPAKFEPAIHPLFGKQRSWNQRDKRRVAMENEYGFAAINPDGTPHDPTAKK